MLKSLFSTYVEPLLFGQVGRAGRATAHLECDLEDGEGRLAARSSSVCAIRRQRQNSL